MKKKKGQKSDKWDQVPIGEEFLADNEFENLISLEVLTDYQIVRKPDTNKRYAESDSDEFDLGGEDLENKKEVKKKKLKKQKIVEPNSDEETESAMVPSIKLKKRGAENSSKTSAESKQILKKKVNDISLLDTTTTSIGSTSSWTVIQEKSSDQPIAGGSQTEKKKKKKKVDKKVVVPVPAVFEETYEDNSMQEDFSNEEWVKLGVPDSILIALKMLGFQKPTPIQSLTLPAALLGKKDIVGAAETGSGKTLAFAIPMINGILQDRIRENNQNRCKLSALVLTPTRELAAQVKDHIEAVAKHSGINVMIIVGGLSSQKQERLLKTSPDIIVCTPGRLWEMMKEGNEYLADANKIRYLAVDETDRMVEKGHFQELEGILGVLNSDSEVCKNRQNFVFSATLAFTHEPPERLNKGKIKKSAKKPKKVSAKEKLNQIMEMIGVRENPKIVDITSKKGTADSLTEMQITCPLNQKDYYLYYFFLQHPGKTIVFSNSINCVRRLTNLFFHLNCEALPLHSEMHQKQRLRNLERFTENSKGILISTDVAARGLDIKDIQFVIHYQVPKTAESYIHRSGRTARLSKDGLAIILIQPDETTTFWNIFRSLGRDEMLPSFEVNSRIFRELKIQVDLACSVEKFEHMLRKKFADLNWMDKAKKDMDLASSDEDSDDRGHGGKKRLRKNMEKAKKELEVSKRKLAELLQTNTRHHSKHS